MDDVVQLLRCLNSSRPISPPVPHISAFIRPGSLVAGATHCPNGLWTSQSDSASAKAALDATLIQELLGVWTQIAKPRRPLWLDRAGPECRSWTDRTALESESLSAWTTHCLLSPFITCLCIFCSFTRICLLCLVLHYLISKTVIMTCFDISYSISHVSFWW